MRRVVVTGLGIVSAIGNNKQEVFTSLRDAKSGIVRAQTYVDLGFRCQVHGEPTLKPEDVVDRRAMRFHGGGTGWNHVAMEQAIADSGLEDKDISNERTGIIMGSGGPSARTLVEAADTTRTKGPKRVGPFAVPKAMSSTASATLATWFKIKGVNYSISSACASTTSIRRWPMGSTRPATVAMAARARSPTVWLRWAFRMPTRARSALSATLS
jgi:3-oxoacyl-[acyl-carrier-protein] synthase-1